MRKCENAFLQCSQKIFYITFYRKTIDFELITDPCNFRWWTDITWDPHWMTDMSKMGQLSAVDTDPEGRIAIFSRRERVWGLTTFDYSNKFDHKNGPLEHDTILLYDKTGRKVLQWGRNMFYLPHGLTIDHEGNYWMTDVALHQVFKFDANDIKENWNLLKSAETEAIRGLDNVDDYENRFAQSIIKPSIVLGQAFEPGNDNRRFCKPTAVAVALNGDFFVSDGYCNSRVIKFNKSGERILHWGRSWSSSGKNIQHFIIHPRNWHFVVLNKNTEIIMFRYLSSVLIIKINLTDNY